jgi:hypothetical protein
VRANLEAVLDSAIAEDWNAATAAWYRYQRIVAGIAARYNYPMKTGAAVFSALSPNNDYHGNLRDTNTLLSTMYHGYDLTEFSVSTYMSNKVKAWRIAQGCDPLTLIVAPKTRNFYLNVIDPQDPVPVTVDGHILNAWLGKRVSLTSAAHKMTRKLYCVVADDIRLIGAERRIIPNIVQAAVWHCWKRTHKILWKEQTELWSMDYFAAGLGFNAE